MPSASEKSLGFGQTVPCAGPSSAPQKLHEPDAVPQAHDLFEPQTPRLYNGANDPLLAWLPGEVHLPNAWLSAKDVSLSCLLFISSCCHLELATPEVTIRAVPEMLTTWLAGTRAHTANTGDKHRVQAPDSEQWVILGL